MNIIKIPSSKKGVLKALICYIPSSYSLPENHPNFLGHSNFQECRALIKILAENGFECDVVDWQENVTYLKGNNYDLLVAVHDQLEYAKSLVKKKGKVIFYSTNNHWLFNNQAEYGRLQGLLSRKGVTLLPRRQLKPIIFEEQIDEIWYLGNSFQEKTYSHINCPKYRINISTIDLSNQFKNEPNKENNNHFLWFGSRGAVHKGLDWLLDIFSKNKQINLHICGLLNQEPDFLKLFARELFNTENIHYYGWLPINSPEFYKLCSICSFIIIPSCSEGGGGAVLQCMATGLIPIVTEESTVDTFDFGFTLMNSSLEELEKTIIKASNLSVAETTDRSKRSYDHIKLNHNLNIYKKLVEERIKSLISAF